MFAISAISLLVIMTSCFAGVFAPKHVYDDNLAQRAGMAGVFLFCLPRFIHLIEHGELTSACMPASAQVLGHVGLALYCVGTASKVWRHKPKRKPPLPPINPELFRQVRGGGK